MGQWIVKVRCSAEPAGPPRYGTKLVGTMLRQTTGRLLRRQTRNQIGPESARCFVCTQDGKIAVIG
jgi:hypothetical protein